MGPKKSVRIFLFCVVIVVSTAAGPENTVTMQIAYNNSQHDIRAVMFTKELFEQFHICLCMDTTKTCTATFQRSNRLVQSIGNTAQMVGRTGSFSLFTCKLLSSHDDRVQCMRLQQCNAVGFTHTTSYHFPSVASCTFNCVGLAWSYTKEGLLISDHDFIDPNPCTEHCNTISGTSTPKVTTTTPVPKVNKTTISETNSEASKDITGVIIGIVVVVVVIITIAIIIFIIILRRRRRASKSSTARTSSSAATPYDDTSTHTDSLNKAFYDKSGLKISNTGTDHVSNGQNHNNNMATRDAFRYTHPELKPDNKVHVRGQQDKQKPDTNLNKTINENLRYVLKKKNNTISQASTVENMAKTDHQVGSGDDYDYATIDNDESISTGQGNLKQRKDIGNRLPANKMGRQSTDIDYGYTVIDLNEGGSSTKINNVGNNENKEPVDNDYEYTESTNPHDAVISKNRTQPTTAHQHNAIEDDYSLAEDSDDSDLNDTTPTPKNVYSKLGDSVKPIPEDYDVLLKPKEDPSKRKPLPKPASSRPETNQIVSLPSAHPTAEASANLAEVLDQPTSAGHQLTNDNLIHEINNAIPEYAMVNKEPTINGPFSETLPEADKDTRLTPQANDEETPGATAVPDYGMVNKMRQASVDHDTSL